MTAPLTYIDYGFAQRALVDLLLLAVIAGAIGPWLVMRSLTFFAHAVGTAAFPGLVIASAIGAPLPLGAAAGAAATTIGAGIAPGREPDAARTGLWLSGSLAAGAIAAGALGSEGAAVDSALFGSLLTLSAADLALTAVLAACSAVAALTAGPRWFAVGLTGRRSRAAELLLVLLVAAATIGQLSASGALLSTALLVLPAVASRPWIRSVRQWQAATLLTAVAAGIGGFAIALSADLPPGASIAAVAGVAVAASLALRTLARRGRTGTPITVAAILATAIVVTGCGTPDGGTGTAGKPTVVATTPLIGDLVSSIAGDRASVRTMVPRGADPHDFEPRPSDMAATSGSGLIFANGGLDEWVEEVRDRSAGSTRLVELLDRVPVRLATGERPTAHDETDGHSHEHGGGIDPHWFHDPRNVAGAGRAIAAELSRLSPSDRDYFDRRARSLAATAARLDSAGRRCISRLPETRRSLVTDHDAFSYLAGRLGLEIAGTVIPSTSASANASARHLENLAATIESRRVPAIFPESALDPKVAKALAERTGVRSDLQLDADTLGPQGSPRDSWAGMWSGNVARIALGLSSGTVRCTGLDGGER